MVLINFKILNGTEENCDISSYSTMMFLRPAVFSGQPHLPNINIIMLSKFASICLMFVPEKLLTEVAL